MTRHKWAYFVSRPRRIEELMRPHFIEKEKKYEVVKTLFLSRIDYENFTADMLADRSFLEEYPDLCSCGEIMKCLEITAAGLKESVLVIPGKVHNIEYSAYILTPS